MAGDADSLPPLNDAVPAEEYYHPEPAEPSSLDHRLADSPILLLVYFHKAFRAELADLRRAVSRASERGRHAPDFVAELLRRFEFLKLACKYHCAAEDEVIFLAIDNHVKNVAFTYSLEHKSIDGLFDSIFLRLNAMLEVEEHNDVVVSNDDVSTTKPFHELVLLIGTIQTVISNHMLKEEKQIFPLLMEHISIKEQSTLVWQFMCSVPTILMEDMFPWVLSLLSPQEQTEVRDCITELVPEEKSLQEVVLSWVCTKNKTSIHLPTNNTTIEGVSELKVLLKSYSCRRYFGQNYASSSSSSSSSSTTQENDSDLGHYQPLDSLRLWHGAIKKDLMAVLGELYQVKSSSNFSNLENIVIHLKFIADIITFYSIALEKVFRPVLNRLVHGGCTSTATTTTTDVFPSENHVEGLHMLLYHTSQNNTNLSKFVKNLCRELQSFVDEIHQQFSFHENEVFPIIASNSSAEMQCQILYVSVHTMPLGLLKCVITWFSSHISEEQCRSVLTWIKQQQQPDSLKSLLNEWLRNACTGKTSTEKFGNNLLQMFKTRRSFLPEQSHDALGSRRVSSFNQKGKSSTSFGQSSRKCDTSYSSVINLHIYFPDTIKAYHPFSEIIGGTDCSSSAIHDPKPMDFIFHFHKALKADLEYLVAGSIHLAENPTFLEEFRRRFELIQFLYQIHSDAEDEVAFPALEAMGKVENISHSYTMDHKIEVEHFSKVSQILDKLFELGNSRVEIEMRKHYQLCAKLHGVCESMSKLLVDHIHREEQELWPLFRECFSVKEQERIVGSILGRTNAEMLQDMIPWLMRSLTQEEQHTMMLLWRQVTRHTMFDEWLREWWEGYDMSCGNNDVDDECDETAPSSTAPDPLEIIFEYLGRAEDIHEIVDEKIGHEIDEEDVDSELFQYDHVEYTRSMVKDDKKRVPDERNVACEIKPGYAFFEAAQKSRHYDLLMKMSQEDLEAAIRRVSRDSLLDSQKKSYMIQNLLVSRWIVRHHSHSIPSNNEQEFPGQHPSYQDPLKLSFGCKHYKRNCKLVAPCCNQLYTCLKCHDEMAGHTIDRNFVKEMMCMQCLKIQPVGATCSTPSCNKFSMSKYFCRICKIFDDERMIYHCPYCNLCRLGKGLGIDYFHCMNCNACMSRTLFVHVCREKSFMDNCPICHEDMFSSSSPVKALPCGHLMHSICFEAYTCTNYTCPICGKSLGDMKVYFKMLDALLAEENIPDEYLGQTQAILCNDCGKRGEAPFHWLYHKCTPCGSYNTRVV